MILRNVIKTFFSIVFAMSTMKSLAQSIEDFKGMWGGEFTIQQNSKAVTYLMKYTILNTSGNNLTGTKLCFDNDHPTKVVLTNNDFSATYKPSDKAIYYFGTVETGEGKIIKGIFFYHLSVDKNRLKGDFASIKKGELEVEIILNRMTIEGESSNSASHLSTSASQQATQTVNGQLQPGDIAPNAKVIDADELFPFSDGVARVKKGNSWALINPKGEFIVPYNKWNLVSDSKAHLIRCVKINGDNNKQFLINTKGEVIAPTINSEVEIDSDGYAQAYENGQKFFINSSGNKIIIKNPYPYIDTYNITWSENLGLINHQSKYGYIDRNFKLVIPPQFDIAEPFSEGLSVVGKKNEFGEMKFGFINKMGQLIIPYNFSIEPHKFSSGIALVTPKNTSDFKYAYINKKGDIVIKLIAIPGMSNFQVPVGGSVSHDAYHFAEWQTESGLIFIDTLGNILTTEQFMAPFHLPYQGAYPSTFNGDQEYITYSAQGGPRVGILNLKSKTSLPLVYKMRSDFKFDSESKLTLAENYAGNKKITGYINTEGVYIMVKAELTKW